jgi:membrane protein
LYELVACGVISQIKVDEDETIAFQPARNPDTMTINYVVDAIEQCGSDHIPVAESEELKNLGESMKRLNDLVDTSPENVLLKDI